MIKTHVTYYVAIAGAIKGRYRHKAHPQNINQPSDVLGSIDKSAMVATLSSHKGGLAHSIDHQWLQLFRRTKGIVQLD